jgi:hypothetical protein
VRANVGSRNFDSSNVKTRAAVSDGATASGRQMAVQNVANGRMVTFQEIDA